MQWAYPTNTKLWNANLGNVKQANMAHKQPNPLYVARGKTLKSVDTPSTVLAAYNLWHIFQLLHTAHIGKVAEKNRKKYGLLPKGEGGVFRG